MKKRSISLLSLLLALLMLGGLLAACADKEAPTESNVPASSESETAQQTASSSEESGTDSTETDEQSSETDEQSSETESDPPAHDIDECVDHKDAYYIIENVASNGRNGIPNGWNYDNRFNLQDNSGRDQNTLYDESNTAFTRLIRDFDPEDNGSFRLEMLISACSSENGIYVAFTDENDKQLFGLKVKGGYWTLFGRGEQATPVAIDLSKTKTYAIEMNFDLEKLTLSAVINNVDCGSVAIPGKAISRLILGTNKEGTGILGMTYVLLSKNYAVNHHFLTNSENMGQTPAEWTVEGDFKLAQINSMRMNDLTSVKADSKAGNTSTAIHQFDAVSGKVAFETMILLPAKTDGASVALMCGDTEAVKFETRDGGKIYVGDLMVNDYRANVWQTLHIEADTDAKIAEIYVNGKLKGTVELTVDSFDGVKIGFAPTADAVMWFDDVEVYNLYDHSDYPEEPQVAASDDYNIGMNVCWLWRDQQSGEGWDATSPFPEFDTYMGFYDEGLRETADWELKWMAEHGIDFAHVCWYCPSGNIQAPIKEMRHSYAALHDGYMMAEYSDYVDFCIMWENNGQDCTSFEQFKEYIWDYWMEYYFSDPRYARIDNRAVLTVWNLSNFRKAFGDDEIQIRKAIAFMNEELQAIGYDGIMLLSSTQGVTSKESYESLRKLGFDGNYAYHWSAAGYSAEHQINCIEKNLTNSAGVNHHIPTVSIGFNDVGRNESRDPIITAADHLLVCQYIKEALADMNTGTWKDNTLFLSTWNEYSEGTYILPTESNGFSYLENVRLTFTNDTSDHTELDVQLTEAQQDRIGHLYPPNHSPIRWHQFERSDEDIRNEPNPEDLILYKTLDNSEDWTRGHGLSGYSIKNGIIVGRSTQGDFSITTSSNFEAFDAKAAPIIHIRMKNDSIASFEIFFATESNSTMNSTNYKSVKITATGEFVDYYVNMSTVSGWSGTITKLRIDPQTASGMFEIELIELMSTPEVDMNTIPSIEVNANRLSFTFDPQVLEDGDYLVVGEAKNKGFYSAMRLYHEWDRFTGDGVLTLYTFDEKKLVFTVGSDKVIVNGEEKDAGFTFTLRDGLPQFHIKKLCELIGYKYQMKGLAVQIQAATDEEYETLISAIPNQWEFENNGVQEGWRGQNSSLLTMDGYLVISPASNDVAIIHDVSFNAGEYTHMVVGVLYDENISKQSLQLFFNTAGSGGWNAERSFTVAYNTKNVGEGDIMEAVVDLSLSAAFSGNITTIRIDPYTGMFEGKIAYIRFLKEGVLPEEKEQTEWYFDTDGNTDGWSGQNVDKDTFTAKDGFLCGTATNGDPSIILLSGLKAADYNKITIGVAYSSVYKNGQIFFLTSASGGWNADKCVSANYEIPADVREGDIIYITFDMSQNSLWNSIITAIRFDMFGANGESFKIDSIKLIPSDPNSVPDKTEPETGKENEVDKLQVAWHFNTDGDLEGWTSQNLTEAGLTVEDGFLYGTSKNGDPAVKRNVGIQASECGKIKIGVKFAEVYRKQTAALFFTTSASVAWDADKCVEAKYEIPANVKEGDIIYVTFDMSSNANWNSIVTAIRFDMFGATEDFAIDSIELFAAETLPGNEKEMSWCFDTNGNTEGWNAQGLVNGLTAEGGFLCGTAKNGDPAILRAVSFEASDYTKITFAVQYADVYKGPTAQLFFITSANGGWNADKCVSAHYSIPSDVKEGDIIYVTFDLASHELWSDTVTGIRFDMFGATESFMIDSITLHN